MEQQNTFLMPPAVRIQLVRESQERYEVSGAPDVYKIASEYLKNEDREHLIVLLLDTAGRVNGIHTVSIGDSNTSIANPREIFKAAILTNSCSIILAHNHPTGNCEPSHADIIVTEKVIEAGKILDIEVLDHVIVGHNCHFSMRKQQTVKF